jgi:hypothetical protein
MPVASSRGCRFKFRDFEANHTFLIARNFGNSGQGTDGLRREQVLMEEAGKEPKAFPSQAPGSATDGKLQLSMVAEVD